MWFGLHAGHGLEWVGRSGVDVFFLISGFIMFHTNATRVRGAVEFWLDRIARIAPLYWVAMIPVILLFDAGRPQAQSAVH
jgi:peptidoglycan/LPS O-acetylase OafA/YrhL